MSYTIRYCNRFQQKWQNQAKYDSINQQQYNEEFLHCSQAISFTLFWFVLLLLLFFFASAATASRILDLLRFVCIQSKSNRLLGSLNSIFFSFCSNISFQVINHQQLRNDFSFADEMNKKKLKDFAAQFFELQMMEVLLMLVLLMLLLTIHHQYISFDQQGNS